MLESPAANNGLLDINCCDPLGRSALLMAIDNENLEMVELLLDNKVHVLCSKSSIIILAIPLCSRNFENVKLSPQNGTSRI